MAHGEITLNGEKINRKVLGSKSLEEVADGMALLPPGSRAIGIFEAELQRRQTEAAVIAAESQKRSARYILWSVLAILATSGVIAVATVLQMFNEYPSP